MFKINLKRDYLSKPYLNNLLEKFSKTKRKIKIKKY